MNETHEPATLDDGSEPIARRRRRIILPLIFFGAIATLFLTRLFAGDQSRLPSFLIGQEVPRFDLPAIAANHPGLSNKDLRQGHVTLVNFFASWCIPCRREDQFLLALEHNATLKMEGVRIVGIAYKDNSDNVRRFLDEDGNPYVKVGTDTSGRVSIKFGVYGVPATYIVKGNGKIAFRFSGPIDGDLIRSTILSHIEKARK